MGDVDIHDARFKALYLQTAREYVGKLTDNFRTLLSGNTNRDVIKEIRINAHSLKGQSAVCGYSSIQDVSLLIETVAKEVLEDHKEISSEQIHALLASLGDVSASLDEIEMSDNELDLSEVNMKLTEALAK